MKLGKLSSLSHVDIEAKVVLIILLLVLTVAVVEASKEENIGFDLEPQTSNHRRKESNFLVNYGNNIGLQELPGQARYRKNIDQTGIEERSNKLEKAQIASKQAQEVHQGRKVGHRKRKGTKAGKSEEKKEGKSKEKKASESIDKKAGKSKEKKAGESKEKKEGKSKEKNAAKRTHRKHKEKQVDGEGRKDKEEDEEKKQERLEAQIEDIEEVPEEPEIKSDEIKSDEEKQKTRQKEDAKKVEEQERTNDAKKVATDEDNVHSRDDLKLSDFVSAVTDWGYSGKNGPSQWKNQFPRCSKSSQSPINIASGRTTRAPELGEIKFSPEYGLAPPAEIWSLKNNGHSVTITPKSDQYVISGTGLGGVYQLAQFHFHWGSSSDRGSEHTINGKQFPMEAHFVHFNRKYSGVREALNYTDGLAVLAVLFVVSEIENEGLVPIVRKLPGVTLAGSQVKFEPIPLKGIIRSDLDKYYRYTGSLTTPGCFESVTWTVFSDTRSLSEKQMEAFRSLKNATNQDLSNNYRPIQPLNKRLVTRNFGLSCYLNLNGVYEWSYGFTNGPSMWSRMFTKCGGKRQSPINIVTRRALAMSMLTMLRFSDDYGHYPVGLWDVYNTDYTLKIVPTTGNYLLSQGSLPGTYRLAEIIFHWGKSEEEGSEHGIDGKKHPLEMQLVHYNMRDKSYEDARVKKDGIAILAFFFDLGRFENNDLLELLKEVPNLSKDTYKVQIPSINIIHLMGGRTILEDYFRYQGSMTSPPCEESVVWTLFPRPLFLSESQLEMFHSLTYRGEIIQQNFRPIQRTNDRLISRTE